MLFGVENLKHGDGVGAAAEEELVVREWLAVDATVVAALLARGDVREKSPADVEEVVVVRDEVPVLGC